MKSTNSPSCAFHGSSEQEPQYDLMTLAYQHFKTCVVVVDLWQSLSEWCLLLSECVWCAIARMSELELE
jgi:hypothetical protein